MRAELLERTYRGQNNCCPYKWQRSGCQQKCQVTSCHPNMPPECQFGFMDGTVTKGRRYAKWYKDTEPPHLELVMEYYGYSKQKALQALQVLTQDNIRDIIQSTDTGGR